jgi:membrane fusion protein, multidrug efflux system
VRFFIIVKTLYPASLSQADGTFFRLHPFADLTLGRLIFTSFLWVTVFAVTGCSRPTSPPPPPPPEVGFVTVTPEKVTLVTELPGRLDAVRVAEVRARVAGILTKRVFVEGSEVQTGEVLALIDPAPFQAALNSAEAALAKAKANLHQYQAQAGRYAELAPIHAVSQQDYDNAVAAVDGGQADVATAEANVVTSKLNLGYATLTAPISGRIGRELVTEGALVGQNEATEIATIQQLDPIYFDFTESSADLLRLRRTVESGQLKKVDGLVKVTLLLEDGSTYRLPGKLLFSDVTVDQTTGTVTLRAEIPNPDKLLLPGMYARGRLEQGVDQAALTVPVRGVQHNPDGSASVMLVNAQNQVEIRPVQLGSIQGEKWVVLKGLNSGDRVIVEGLQKIGPGMPVTPVPFTASPATAAPAPGGNS